MPVTLAQDIERRIAVTICSGVVSDEELLKAREKVLADPNFDPSFDRLWDFTEVTEAQVSDAVIAQMVGTSPESTGRISRAVVVSRMAKPMKRIIGFISRTRSEGRRIAAFPDRETAERWIEAARLDLPPA